MIVAEFMKRLRMSTPSRAWSRLKTYARRGYIKWGEVFFAYGPESGRGG